MSGYFTGTDPDIGLGDWAMGTAQPASELIALGPTLPLSSVLTCHGGILSINLLAYCERASLGDAEWWLTQKLEALAGSAAGTLAFEDNQDRPVTYEDALFVSATGMVHAYQVAVLEAQFLAPMKSAQPGWGPESGTGTETWADVPDEPAEYAARTTSQNYLANGQELGLGPMLSLAVDRRAQLRVIPRCKGARVSADPAEARMTIEISADLVSDTDHWQVQLEDKVRSIGVGPFGVTGNGNTWDLCRLVEARPEPSDVYATSMLYRFQRELA